MARAVEPKATTTAPGGGNASEAGDKAKIKAEKKPGILRRMKNWMEGWALTKYALLALIILAFAESSFFPIPPDVLLIALCIVSPERAFLFAFACSCASVAGGLFGYFLGRVLYEPVVKPVSRFIRLDKYLDGALDLYNRYDVLAVFIAGFTPIPYKVFTIAGGLAKLNIFKFAVASAVSRSARFFLVATLLFFFGKAANDFIDAYFNLLALAFGVLLIGSFFLVAIFFGKKEKDAGKDKSGSNDLQASSAPGEGGKESGAKPV
ncbi:MAG: DedA family protein [Planctomycetota bacterium]|nr:MAG: DedA family protein [Planctomycetota bacterium]